LAAPWQAAASFAITDCGVEAGHVLTRGDSRDRQPVYAPDGATILFSSNRAGNLDLWMVSVATGEVRRLTDDAANDWDPAYTPDGKQVMWSSGRSGNLEIWTAAVDGSGARQITRDGVDAENPTATPDGRWIVYSSGNPAHNGIWRIRPDGSEAARLVSGGQFLPDTSPAAPLTAFVRHLPDSPVNEIKVVNVESGELLDFTISVRRAAPGASEGSGSGNLGRPRWLRDGSAIAFIGVDEAGRHGVFVQDFVPGRDTSTTRRKLVGFASDREAESFAFSPDGRRVALAEVQESASLMLAEKVPGIGSAPD
jgi:Tol biopolymer transport system component